MQIGPSSIPRGSNYRNKVSAGLEKFLTVCLYTQLGTKMIKFFFGKTEKKHGAPKEEFYTLRFFNVNIDILNNQIMAIRHSALILDFFKLKMNPRFELVLINQDQNPWHSVRETSLITKENENLVCPYIFRTKVMKHLFLDPICIIPIPRSRVDFNSRIFIKEP